MPYSGGWYQRGSYIACGPSGSRSADYVQVGRFSVEWNVQTYP